ncbi:hypothetical protein J6590_071006 [Homalodisca vitripennis]|nr:hypothetical protein J6590_071006 [Homalodisca vitripennis]
MTIHISRSAPAFPRARHGLYTSCGNPPVKLAQDNFYTDVLTKMILTQCFTLRSLVVKCGGEGGISSVCGRVRGRVGGGEGDLDSTTNATLSKEFTDVSQETTLGYCVVNNTSIPAETIYVFVLQ